MKTLVHCHFSKFLSAHFIF